MCLSPHEMNSSRIEKDIAYYQGLLDDPSYADWHKMYRGRIENFEALLKERAEDGTYNDDFEAAA